MVISSWFIVHGSSNSVSNSELPTTNKNKGFTLVELLVVIVILGILAAIGAAIYTQVQLKARDAARITDLNSIKNAIQITTHDATDMAQALCAGTTAPCTESTYPKGANTQKTDGSGWIKVNFDAANVANFERLPVDPLNNAQYYYTYKSDGQYWEIDAVLESSDNKNLMIDDGGNDDTHYEVGVNVKNL